MFSSARLRGLTKWARSGAWAITEQGFFSATNLTTNIVLARSLGGAGYGEFAATFSILVLVELAHRALFAEPMLVFYPKHQDHPRSYVRILVSGHFIVTGCLSLVLALIAAGMAVSGFHSFATTFGGLAVAVPMLLLLSLLRRLCYAQLQVVLAAAAGAIYLLVVTSALVTLNRISPLSGATAYIILGTAAALLSGILLWRLTRHLTNKKSQPFPTLRTVAVTHWQFARWAIPSAFVSWVPGNIYYLVLPLFGSAGLIANGLLRAAVTLLMPILQVNATLGTLLVTTFSTRLRAGKPLQVSAFLALLSVLSLGYWLIIALARHWITDIVYGPEYAAIAPLLPWFGSLAVVTGVVHVLRSLQLAHNHPRRVFFASLCGAIFTMTGGILFAHIYLLPGVIFGIVLANTMAAALLARVHSQNI